MSKLKEKELLEYFDGICLFLANHHWTKRDERAVAIREMIQKKPEVDKELINKYAEKFREYFERGFSSRNHYKGLLKQFSQEAGLEVAGK